MKYKIEKGQKRPAYLQLYSQLRDDIVNEVFAVGSKLPSKRLVAEELGVSTVTVEHAYSLLCDEGYIEARERSGYFVIFRKVDGMYRPAEQSFPSVRPHHINTKQYFSFPLLAKAMRRVINDYGDAILEKSDESGCIELREAICRYLERSKGVKATPDRIIVGSGSEYLYGLISQLLGKEKCFAIESPSYKKIGQVYESFAVKTDPLPLGSDGIESAALWNTRADVLHITPYRSFPSGVTATASKRHEYIKWASQKGRYIIEDDFESEFSVKRKPEETLFAASDSDNVIYMNTFSRTISPALRVGYMVLPEALMDEFRQRLGFYSCTVPTFEQLLLSILLDSGDFERHINRVRRKLRTQTKNKAH